MVVLGGGLGAFVFFGWRSRRKTKSFAVIGESIHTIQSKIGGIVAVHAVGLRTLSRQHSAHPVLNFARQRPTEMPVNAPRNRDWVTANIVVTQIANAFGR